MMCDYTQVEYACGHLRFTVRAWCIKYQESHKRCPPNVVAIEYRLNEKCGDCRDSTSPRFTAKKKPSSVCKPPTPDDTPAKKKDRSSTPTSSK